MNCGQARKDQVITRKNVTEKLIVALCTTRISLSTSTERLFAWTITLYSGFECSGMDIASLDDGLAWYFSISCAGGVKGKAKMKSEETYTQNLCHPSAPLKPSNLPHVVHSAELHSLHLLRIKFLCGLDTPFKDHPRCLFCFPIDVSFAVFRDDIVRVRRGFPFEAT